MQFYSVVIEYNDFFLFLMYNFMRVFLFLLIWMVLWVFSIFCHLERPLPDIPNSHLISQQLLWLTFHFSWSNLLASSVCFFCILIYKTFFLKKIVKGFNCCLRKLRYLLTKFSLNLKQFLLQDIKKNYYDLKKLKENISINKISFIEDRKTFSACLGHIYEINMCRLYS